MRTLISALIIIAIGLGGCNHPTKPAGTASSTKGAAPKPAPESVLGKEATGELTDMLGAYYNLKDALVAANNTKADDAASKLLSAAELFNHGLGDKPEYTTLQPQLQIIMHRSDSLIAAKGDTIEQKRIQFATISDAMHRILSIAKLRHAGVYHEYCPMAMKDKGAYWLSAESEIKNPYYGRKMLECGEVKDSF